MKREETARVAMHCGMSSELYISLSHLPGQCQRAESFFWAVDNSGNGKGEGRDKERKAEDDNKSSTTTDLSNSRNVSLLAMTGIYRQTP